VDFWKEASLTEASLSRKMDVEETDPEYERLRLIPTDKMTEDEYDYFKAKSRQQSVEWLWICKIISKKTILRKYHSKKE